MSVRMIVVVLGALSQIAACGGLSRPSSATDADSSGVQRVVSLAPSLSETILALGAGDRLVGRSDWCTSSEDLLALPALGSTMTPSWEPLIAVRPDHIFVEANHSTPIAELQAIAPTTAIPWLTLEQVIEGVETLATVLDRRVEGNALVQRLSRTLGVEAPADGPQVLLVFASPGLGEAEAYYIRNNSLHGRALTAAGARNAVTDDDGGPPMLSPEQLVNLSPDAIIVLADTQLTHEEEARLASSFRRIEPLSEVPVGVLSGKGLLVTGPGIVELATALRRELNRLLP